MKPLLSVHPWVRVCTAELNMSPFSLLQEPLPLLFLLISALKPLMFEDGVYGIFSDRLHIWELQLIASWQQVKLWERMERFHL